MDLLESFRDNNLGLRHVSFKFSTKEGFINAIRMNFQREKKWRFDFLKEVEHERKRNNKSSVSASRIGSKTNVCRLTKELENMKMKC